MKKTRGGSRYIQSIGSTVKPKLRELSSNIRRLERISNRFRDDNFDTQTTRRMRLARESRSTSQEDLHGETTPSTSVHSMVSSTGMSIYRTNLSSVGLLANEGASESMTDLKSQVAFRKACKIEILGVENRSQDIAKSCQLVDAEFETLCTLEIFAGTYGKNPLIATRNIWEELFRMSRVGTFRTLVDNGGGSSARVVLESPFLIPAEQLFIERDSHTINCVSGLHRNGTYRCELADHYLVKIWFEPHNSKSKWPPLDPQSSLDPEGKIMQWLSCGVFAEKDIRLSCRGIISPGLLSQEPFNLEFNLAGRRQHTQYSLNLDVQWSCLTLPGTRLGSPKECLELPEFQNLDAMNEERLTESGSPLVLRPHYPEKPEIEDMEIEHSESALGPLHAISQEPWSQKCYKFNRGPSTRLIIPNTGQKLYHPVTKHVLKAGEELFARDYYLEDLWRSAKHVDVVKELPNIGDDARDYIMKWDYYATSLKLSCNLHLSRAVVDFIRIHRVWLAERKIRIRECSLHVTVLRLRGSIHIECFTKCITILQECNKFRLATEDSSWAKVIDQTSGHEHAEIEDAADSYGSGKEASNEGRVEDASADEDIVPDSEAFEKPLDEDVLNNIHQYASDSTRDSSEESSYEDSREYPQILTIDDFIEIENPRDNRKSSQILRACWKGITERWPRLRLHGMDSFGVASMLAAIVIFQGFPDSNIDRLIALNIHYCPNEDIQDLTNMYHNATDVVPKMEGVFMTRLKLHKIMWEAGQEKCEEWLTDVYRLPDGSRRNVQDAIDFAMKPGEWDELWNYITFQIASK